MAAAASTVEPSSPSDMKPEPAKQLYVRYVEYACSVVALMCNGAVSLCQVFNIVYMYHIVTHTGLLIMCVCVRERRGSI